MDQAEFDRRMQSLGGGQQAPASPSPTNGAEGVTITVPQETVDQLGSALGVSSGNAGDPQGSATATHRPDGTRWEEPPAEEPGLGDPTGLDAIAGGALKSGFETKDFLFGDTPPERQSEFRRNVEETVEQRSEESMIDGFAAEIAQFATAMIGLGKLKMAAGALPWVGKGLAAVEGTKRGAVAVEVGQAALAGAIAFDPHEERLSNLIQQTPLSNPLNAWLAADPEDGEAEGRLKAAFESIGLDLTLGTVFIGASRVWKYMKAGEMEKAAKEAARIEKEAQDAIATEQQAQSGGLREGDDAEGGAPASPVAEGAPTVDGELPGGGAGGPDNAAAQAEGEVISEPAVSRDVLDVRSRDPKATPLVRFTDEDTAAVYDGLVADMRAIATHNGDWTQTVETGHVFAQGEGIPYQKLNNAGELDSFVSRIALQVREQLDDVKGGAVLPDSQLAKDVEQIAKLFNEDPAAFMGTIQMAGADATALAARMEASYLVANRMFQDAYALAVRIQMGDYVKYGSKAAAENALRQRLSLAGSVYGSAKAMSSSSARALRRMRSDFAIDQTMVENLSTVDPSVLTELVVATAGNPRNLKKLAAPSLWAKGMDFWQFLYINNLVSGPKTQLINLTTNAYMLGVRPLERIIGGTLRAAAGNSSSLMHVRQSLKQYTYMGTASYDGFQQAAKAFARNDSILTPHQSEAYTANRLGEASGVVKAGAPAYKPWDNIPNIFANTMTSLNTAIGVPTRVLGTVDELMKQTTYRSKVMAEAYYDGVEKGVKSGLSGDQLKAFVDDYVTTTLDNSFDAMGRGTNARAVNEANIATFQQELLPNTWGKDFQNIVTRHPEARLLLPFVKTPTNVLRYGWKMTPGLNLLQKEYMGMLRGDYGDEAVSQAIGQMGMGALWMGGAAYMVLQGNITGSGPQGYQTGQEWRATGAQPYAVVVENDDGTKTYINYGRYDPVAIPMGIIADLQDAIAASEGNDKVQSEIQGAITALSLAMASQFRNKAYLLGISEFMDAVSQPGTNGERLERWMGRVAANTVPYSAAMRQFNNDPYLREAREVTDRIMATIPGYSDELPARYDAWGDPILGRKGLWSTDKNDVVDHEVQRMALSGFGTPTAPSPYHEGIDLRDITTSDGKNAYAVYQEFAGQLPGAPKLKDVIRQIMETDAYQQAPDGDMTVKGTKLWLLHTPISKYRAGAMKMLRADPVVGEALLGDRLKVIEHYRKRETPSRATDAPAPVAPPPTFDKDLKSLGDAFGIDLAPQ